jgi:predicted DNA-binding transcriptional regulator YafY
MKMAKKPDDDLRSVTTERATRLYALITLVALAPRARQDLIRKLRMDVRGFYRDLNLLRAAGIELVMSEGKYRLDQTRASAYAMLPFPDPRLTLGEAREVARGRSAAHRKLARLIASITGTRRAGRTSRR